MSVCSRDRAAAFTHSLCTCSNALGPRGLEVNSTAEGGAVAVGVNGMFAVPVSSPGWPGNTWMGGPANGNGNGWGPRPMDPGVMPGRVSIAGDLQVGGALAFAGDVSVAGNLWSASAPVGTGTLSVGGDLYSQMPSQTPANVVVSGASRIADPWPGPPCACGPNAQLDIAALVGEAAQQNDNSARGFDAGSLVNMLNDASLDLRCGRYYLQGVAVLGTLTLRVTGHAVLFVNGDFTVGSVRTELADGAELDLLVAGSYTSDDGARFAAPEQAARARIYVADQLLFVTALERAIGTATERATLVGNFYAPKSNLQLSEPLDLHGSLFINQLFLLQDLTLHSTLPRGTRCGF